MDKNDEIRHVIKSAKVAESFGKPEQAGTIYMEGLKTHPESLNLLLVASAYFHKYSQASQTLKPLLEFYERANCDKYELAKVTNAIRAVMNQKCIYPEAMRWLDKTISLLTEVALAGRFPPEAKKKNKETAFTKGTATSILMDIITDAYASGVQVVPSHGTLLGMERDGKLFPWDKDIDFVSFLSHSEKIKGFFEGKGYKLINAYSFDTLLSFTPPNSEGPPIDVMLFTKCESGAFLGGFRSKNNPDYWQLDQIFTDLEIDERVLSNNKRVYWLKNPITFLEECYGKDWLTPNPNWAVFASEPNLPRSDLNNYYCKIQISKRWFRGQLKGTLNAASESWKKYPCDTFINEAYVALTLLDRSVEE